MTGIIERAVRKAVTGTAKHERQCEQRERSDDLLEAVEGMEARLSRAESARLEAERERDQAVFELERIFHFVPAYLIFKDLNGVLTRVNEYTAKGFGLTPADMIGRHQSEFWPADQVAHFEEDDARVVAARKGRYGYLEDVMWDGETHTFRTWKIPIYNGKPDPVGILLYAIDLDVVCARNVAELGQALPEPHAEG